MNQAAVEFPKSRIESGIPFVVQVSTSETPLPSQVTITPLAAQGATSFQAPIKTTRPLSGIVELMIDLPGTYRMTILESETSFEIYPRNDLSFGMEFGIFFLAVSLIVGGMLVWLTKKKPL